MHTYESLIRDLKASGVAPNETVVAHTSMKAIGAVDGGPDTVLDAMTAYFEPGTIAIPTLSWELMREPDAEKRVFDVKNTPTSTGLIPRRMLTRSNVVRSLHPTHSVTVYGATSAELIKNDRFAESSCGMHTAWRQLYEQNAYIMMVGCTMNSCTFVHGVEEWGASSPMPLSDPISYTVIPADGETYQTQVCCHKVAGTSHHFYKLDAPLREAGILKTVQFGDATVLLMRAQPLYELTCKMLDKEPELFYRP